MPDTPDVQQCVAFIERLKAAIITSLDAVPTPEPLVPEIRYFVTMALSDVGKQAAVSDLNERPGTGRYAAYSEVFREQLRAITPWSSVTTLEQRH